MVDQTRLPAVFEYLSYDSAAGVAEGIRSMVVRGAPAIGVAAAYGVALEALRQQSQAHAVFDAALDAGFTVLAESRPTAVNLFWALERMRRCQTRHINESAPEVASALLAEASAIHDEDIAINRQMGEYGAALLPDGARVLTHCNAGALATAGHGTALAVLRSLVPAGKRILLIAEDNPHFLQGPRRPPR